MALYVDYVKDKLVLTVFLCTFYQNIPETRLK